MLALPHRLLAQDWIPQFTLLESEELGFILEYPTEDTAGIEGADYGGGGISLRDFNGDGHVDILVGGGLTVPTTLLVHDGAWTFTPMTEEAGLLDLGWDKGVTAADYDNDGDPDVFIAVAGAPSALLLNDGGVFTNVSEAAGLVMDGDARVGVWSDFDRDGHLDLYVVRYGPIPDGEANSLYRNLGDGTFEDVSVPAQIQYSPPGPGDGHVGNTWSALAFDVDQDGYPELYDLNDWGYKHYEYGHKMWKSTAGGLPFTLAPESQGTGVLCNCMGSAMGDLNGDGTLDLYSANTYHGNVLLYNHCGEFGPDSGDWMGVEVGYLSWSVAMEDFDLNGELDLYVATWHETNNRMFLQDGGEFIESGSATQTKGKYWEATTTVGGDLDGDGDEDIVVYSVDSPLVLFRNEGPVGNGVQIILEGTTSNRDAVGALVEARGPGFSRTVSPMSPSGFLSTNDRRLTIGMGSLGELTDVRVRWPSGLEQTFPGPWASGELIALVEGDQPAMEPVGEGWFPEQCGDGIDNDCDGEIDEGFELLDHACHVGVGECEASDQWECTEDALGLLCPAISSIPLEEICDGLDNDCDGETDEGFVGELCSAGEGACRVESVLVCLGLDGWNCDAVALDPSDEICGDGVDNDCDGAADEGFQDVGGSCEKGEIPCLEVGTWTCVGTATLECLDVLWPYRTEELCEDGIDNDCDGQIDEGFEDLGETCDADPACEGDSGRWACDGAGALKCVEEIPCPPADLPDSDPEMGPANGASAGGCRSSSEARPLSALPGGIILFLLLGCLRRSRRRQWALSGSRRK